jgi:twinkle protein
MKHIKIEEIGWAESRGLDVELAAKHGLVTEGKKIGFRYEFGGQTKFTKWRNQDKTGWHITPSGQPLQLFNVDCLSDYSATPDQVQTPLIITEGELDAISCIQAGLPFVVSVPAGAGCSKSEGIIEAHNDKQFQYLWDAYDVIKNFKKVILFTDNDDAGLTLRNELAIRIDEKKCFYVPMPEGCKDANDILARHGVEALKKAIDEARPLVSDDIVGLFELPPMPKMPVILTGWEPLNEHCLLTRPEFMVITGEPGTGKSQFARALAFHLSFGVSKETFKSGNDVLRGMFFTLEDPASRLQRDSYQYMKNILGSTSDPKKQQRIREVISDRIKAIKPSDDVLSLDWAAERIEWAVTRHNCNYIVLDPWNEIEHDFGKQSETIYIGNAIRRLKRICSRLGVLLIVVAHPTKVDKKSGPVDLYSIAGSANWYNKADHGIVLSKPEWGENILKVDVQKSKDWETMGNPGAIYMRFSRDKKDFACIPPQEVEELKAAHGESE